MTETHYPHDDTRIQSPELAHHIGYAQYPHIELARTAFGADAQGHMLAAEAAGKEAAEQYAREIAADIGRFVGTLKSPGESVEPDGHEETASPEKYPGVFVTKGDMIQFAQTKVIGDESIQKAASSARGAWGSLESLVLDLSGNLEDDGIWSHRKVPIIAVEIVAKKSSDDSKECLEISLDSLVDLLDEFDRLKERYPTKIASAILGTNFGDVRLALVRDFVADKRTQLDAQNGENSDQPS